MARTKRSEQLPAETMTEIARLARKGLDAEQIRDRMADRPIDERWDLDVHQVSAALEQLAADTLMDAGGGKSIGCTFCEATFATPEQVAEHEAAHETRQRRRVPR